MHWFAYFLHFINLLSHNRKHSQLILQSVLLLYCPQTLPSVQYSRGRPHVSLVQVYLATAELLILRT